MTFDKKLDLVNNFVGLFGVLYTVIVIIITFIFKENSQKILSIVTPLLILLGVLFVITFILIDYFKRRFAEIIYLHERLRKLEEAQALDGRLRKIEEKLIKQQHILNAMPKHNNFSFLNKRGNTVFLYTLLVILLLAFLVWLVVFLRTP